MSANRNGAADVVGGVRLGVHTSSFRELRPKPGVDGVDTLIAAMTACDVRDGELAAPLVEPSYGGPASAHHAEMSAMTPQMMRRELRKWRLRTPMEHFTRIGARFQRAGIAVSAYNYSPDSTFTDEEIDRGFSAAKALGADIMTASLTPALATRVAPFADRHRMVVALPAQLDAALSMSPYFKINVDVGGCTADTPDPVAFIREHHTEIACLHLKDCRAQGGDAAAWGDGDTPIRQALQLLKRERWPIRAYVEYEYRGAATPVEEVKRCLAYAKQALA
jgi:hypothetical protein